MIGFCILFLNLPVYTVTTATGHIYTLAWPAPAFSNTDAIIQDCRCEAFDLKQEEPGES